MNETMNILVLGSGGREHVLVSKIRESLRVDEVFCIPGNAGISKIAKCVNLSLDDHKALIEYVKQCSIDLTIVGPEAPLAAGIVDAFQAVGLKIFGVSRSGAQLESSKIFAKNLMHKYNVPTADFKIFTDLQDALNFLKSRRFPQVIKADGLAAGKGVIIVNSYVQGCRAIDDIMKKKVFGSAGERVLIEEYLEGEEASILVLTDSETVVPLVSSQDHKRVFDNDVGANTGGMGAYSPAPISEAVFKQIIDCVVVPTISGLKAEGIEYKGVLYAGIMLTRQGPKVLEFNVRFGDPETQAVLPRLKTDIVNVFEAVVEGRLKDIALEWDSRSCVCVVLASGGYPGKYEKGKYIGGLKDSEGSKNVSIFHAGTRLEDGKIVTCGGRVLGISGLGVNLEKAIVHTYAAVNKLNFENMHFRKDIAQRALKSHREGGFDPKPGFKINIK